ncbi:Luciferin 4-monooxygenase [Eumeta japonica]|uniref:Luciferin 4-monooxygenase n=1 Tax=Eumeta variegata TaxID=151549 RepID=A0A4C1VAN5_EUMVA|nr:Luciferin 4-monooxygenase [Eumeta japonica]
MNTESLILNRHLFTAATNFGVIKSLRRGVCWVACSRQVSAKWLRSSAATTTHWYLGELGARGGRGRPARRAPPPQPARAGLPRGAPDFIDGATGEQETCASVRARSVRCAERLRALGLQPGDVVALLAPNHLDLAIPFYAAFYLGLVIMAMDRTLKDSTSRKKELQDTFAVGRPKVVFCQKEKGVEVEKALKAIDCESKIITFDWNERFQSFADFLAMNRSDTAEQVLFKITRLSHLFKVNELDTENALCAIIATSGTTGLPKAAGVTYKNMALSTSYFCTRYTQFPRPYKSALVVSPLQWYSALYHFFCAPIHMYTRIQTSGEPTREHVYALINKYRNDTDNGRKRSAPRRHPKAFGGPVSEPTAHVNIDRTPSGSRMCLSNNVRVFSAPG